MANQYFKFKEFTIHQRQSAMKVCTDSCLFGAWLANYYSQKQPKQILDIGCGTGLLSLMLAQELKTSKITAVEIDNLSFDEALQNVAKSSFANNIKVSQTDYNCFETAMQFDVILSNPPFYEHQLPSPNNRINTAHHSRNLTINNLIGRAKNMLSDKGHIALLVPYERLTEIEMLLKQQQLTISNIALVKHSNLKNPFRAMLIANNYYHNSSTTETISIYQSIGLYTKEFIAYLQPYYLHL